MIDLHTHSLLTDGELLPSELARRAKVIGYKAIAITDHVDVSNIEQVTKQIVEAAKQLNKSWKIKVIPGVELTHLPLKGFAPMVRLARRRGIKLILGHGETISEPVLPGTNRAAIMAGVDILAHPGLISEKDVRLAAKKGVYLEITSRANHALTNGHVAQIAGKVGAKLIINTDAHVPKNLLTKENAQKILRGAGLSKKEIKRVFQNSLDIVRKIF